MKPIKLIFTIITVFSALSCVQQNGGLFYSLEQEAAITNGTLSNEITVVSMEKKYGLTKDTGYYFINAAKFMYIAENADDTVEWTVKHPTGLESSLCLNMIMINDFIYAVFYDSDGTNFSLHQLDVSPSAPADWEWEETSFTYLDTDETIVDFAKAHEKLFVYTVDSSKDHSVYAADISGFSSVASFATIKTGLSTAGDIKADYDGSNYWIAVGNKVFTTDGTTIATPETPEFSDFDNLSGDGFSGIVCADTDTEATGTEVYLTSEEGVMLKYINGEWEIISNSYDEDDGLFPALYGIKHIEIDNGNDQVNIIIAGSAAGYYEMQFETPENGFLSAEEIDTSLTTYNQFASIDLSENVILDFFFDYETDDEKIYALCNTGGLWKNSLLDDSTRFWNVE